MLILRGYIVRISRRDRKNFRFEVGGISGKMLSIFLPGLECVKNVYDV